jgi:hypothetical protein
MSGEQIFGLQDADKPRPGLSLPTNLLITIQYGYKFEVDGKTFTGWESPKGRELAIRKQVIVFYDSQNPRRNALTDFHDVGTSALGPVPMLLFGIGDLVGVVPHGLQPIQAKLRFRSEV